MQLWIFFESGTGGDGFCNLLEQSLQCRPLDSKKFIRVDRYVDMVPKFWMPTVDSQGCFRCGQPYKNNNNHLSPYYVDFVKNSQPGFVIVPTHDVSLGLLHNSDNVDLLTKNQTKVRLYRRDIKQQITHALRSNLVEHSDKTESILAHYDRPLPGEFDFEYCIDDLWSSWAAFRNFCQDLNIVVEQKYYDLICSVKNGEFYWVTTGTDYYETYVENHTVKYQKISTESATKHRTTASHYYGFDN